MPGQNDDGPLIKEFKTNFDKIIEDLKKLRGKILNHVRSNS